MSEFGPYTLMSRLGYGGMAEVFLARTTAAGGFEKFLAIKRLLPACTQDQQTVDLLADEARVTVRLNHPNIVQVFDFGQVDGVYYIAMEYVDGLDLKSLVQIDERLSQPLPVDVALFVVISLLDALDFAHNRTDESGRPLGIIHRDVSPHNVLLSPEGQVKLADFGVARAAISQHVSVIGDIRGKFSYMPPEQACGGEIDHRVDIFATGAIFYELLSGRQPYRSTSSGEQMVLLGKEVEPPSRFRLNLSADLDQLTLRALAKDPAERYGSAREFARALRQYLDQHYEGGLLGPQQRLAGLVERRLAEFRHQVSDPALVMRRDEFSIQDYSLILDPDERRSQRPSSEPGADHLHTAQTAVATPGRRERGRVGRRDDSDRPGGLDEAVTTLMPQPDPASPFDGNDEMSRTNPPVLEAGDFGRARGRRPRQQVHLVDLGDADTLLLGGESEAVTRIRHDAQGPPQKKRREDRVTDGVPPITRRAASQRRMLGILLLSLPPLAGVGIAFWLAAGRPAPAPAADLDAAVGTPEPDQANPAMSGPAAAGGEADLAMAPAPISADAAAVDAVGPSASAPRVRPRGPPGFLTVNAVPWAHVEVDGRLLADPTPLLRHALPSGWHRVRVHFVASNRTSGWRRVRIHPRRETKIIFRDSSADQ